MKKTVKQALIWGTTVAALGGIAAAIAVPVVKATHKTTKTNPIKDVDTSASGQATDELTSAQMLKALEGTGIADSSLLSKVQYQLAFFQYDKEQEGSIAYQREFLVWDQYSINKNLKKLITDTLGTPNTTVINADKGTFDSLAQEAGNLISAKKQAANEAGDKNTVSKMDSAQTSLDNFKKDFNKKETLIKNIDNKSIDYNNSSFASDYPKLLLPRTNIADKQAKIYDDQKSAFIATYKGTADGNAEWQKQISSKFGGATNRDQAIDYLVNAQVSSAAWAKFTLKVNSDFTYEQFNSGIFKDILGEVSAPKVKIKTYTGTQPSDEAKANDKVYFFGSGSRIAEEMNISAGTKLSDPAYSAGLKGVIRIHNAIIGFKQDAADSNKPWTITKGQLEHLFTYYGSGSLPADLWENVFSSATGDSESQTTKDLIAFSSETTDSTQFKAGDLGYYTRLATLSQMYPGFSLGAAAELDQIDGGRAFGGAVLGGTTPADNFLGKLMDALKGEFIKIWNEKHGSTNADPFSTTYTSVAAQTKFNDDMKSFIEAFSDTDIARLGKIVRDFMMSIQVDATGAIVSSGTALNGLPAAIQIGSGTGMGIFIAQAEESGMHVVKIETLSDATTAISKLNAELQAAADKQDQKAITTDWAKFISEGLSKNRQMQITLGGDTGAGMKWIQDAFAKDSKTFGTNSDGTPTYGSFDLLKTAINQLIDSTVKSEELSRVQAGYNDKVYTWLQTRIDNKLFTADTTHSLTPEEIYEVVKVAGGK